MTLSVESDWAYEHVRDIRGGVNVAEHEQEIEKSQFVALENLVYRKGRIEVDTGYVTFQETVEGTPRAAFQFFKKDNSSELMMFTNSRVYTETSDMWYYVHDGDAVTAPPTLTATANATDTSITVSSISGFADGDPIGIALDDNTQHQTTVNGTPAGSTIAIDDAIPSTGTIGNTVVKAIELTGSDANQVSISVLAAFDYLVFTNNMDNVKYYDGSVMRDIPNTPTNTKCAAVAVYENYLLLVNTKENGTSYPQRVRWSAQADIVSADAWPTSNTNDLYDTEDFNVTAVPLGPYMMIYRERSIERMEYVGTVDKTFNWDTMISGEGVLSVDSVVDIGSEHIFVGNSNIYKYQGGFDLDPIGDNITDKLFGINGEMSVNDRNKIVCVYIEETDEIWVHYPLADDTYPTRIAKLNLSLDAWTFRTLPIAMTGFGFYLTDSTLKWNELSGTWLQQTWQWGGVTSQAGSPITLLLSATGGNQAYSYNYVASTDNGTTISWSLETKEFFNPEYNMRHDRLDLKASGATLLVEFSTDGSESFNTLKSTTLPANKQTNKLYKQFVGDRIRYKMSGDGPGFSMEWYGFRFRPESIN